MNAFPHYSLPSKIIVRTLAAALRVPSAQSCRSFRADAQACVAGLRPELRVYGQEHIPRGGPCLLTLNHYSRPGFGAWWLALSVSAVVPADVRWIMTSAWTYPDRLRAHTVTPLTRWLFARLAHVYGFVTMPPMPPDPRDVAARAVGVRQVLSLVRTMRSPVIGLAPEGGDVPGGVLQWPPSGAGRFMLHLAQRGLALVPVGGFEADGVFCLRFGPAYRLEVAADLSARERDREASRVVMCRIAMQLPAQMRGEFA